MKSPELYMTAVTSRFFLAGASFISLRASLVEAAFTMTIASVVEEGTRDCDPEGWEGEASSEGTNIPSPESATNGRA